MRRLFVLASVILIAAGLGSGTAFGQASKAAVKVSEAILMNEVTMATVQPGVWVSLLAAEPLLIKNGSGQKDFFIGVSLECGMFTETKVKGQKGGTAEADALAGVRVRVIMDKGTPNQRIAVPFAAPADLSGAGQFDADFDDGIIFCRRNQHLKAVLGGVLESCQFTCDISCDQACLDAGGSPADCCQADCSFTKEDCVFTDEEIELALRTLGAHHFNFLIADVGASGTTHTIDVEVQVDIGETTSSDANSTANAKATALLGRGIVTVQEVRLIKDADVIWTP